MVTEMSDHAIELTLDLFNKSRYFFYLANPYDTMFPDLNMPRYVTELFPVFILLSVVENGIRLLRGKSILRLNDSIASLSSGLFQDCFRIHIRSIEVLCYCLVYDHFRWCTLPWDSLTTWLLCFLLVDIGFYWAHRLAHEVNFVWAIHQAHHSGEDFTIVAALRQAFLQPFTAWITYIPLALLGIPPSIFLVHLQLTELYMVWIHTEAVKSLGPLEWFLNSPSHHRVHHARNRKYIDKNYGALFIFWDKLFGTFQKEDPTEPVVYGLVKPVESYNPFYIQFHTWISMYYNIRQTQGWRNKIAIPFMGPGWAPGKPRLGYLDEVPELTYPVTYWNPPIHFLKKVYVVWHFVVILIFYHELSSKENYLSQLTIFVSVCTVLFSLTTLGFLLENKPSAIRVETLRCILFFLTERRLAALTELNTVPHLYRTGVRFLVRLTFLISAIIGLCCELHRMSRNLYYYVKCYLKHKYID